MPKSQLLLYREQEDSENALLLEWLEQLSNKAQDKCRVRLGRLAELGHELRRPEADILRDGIYELRVGLNHINYRMLYFFHGKDVVVLSHGLTKKKEVPDKEIDLAIKRKNAFKQDPKKHTFVKQIDD